MAISPEVSEDAAAARLEQALERIAALAARPAAKAAVGKPGPANGAEVAGRLDTLIATLSDELAGDSHS